MYCIDASVLINSEIEGEDFHKYSRDLMNYIREKGIMAFVPEIVCAEVSSAIARGTDVTERAVEFADELREIPNFIFVPIDPVLSQLASKLAAEHRLRGCDAIYVAVAFLFKVKLITLDDQQRKRGSKCVETLTPEDELNLLGEGNNQQIK